MSSNSGKTKNDIAWEKLFETHGILDQINKTGIYKISSKSINEWREARLMTKFDHDIQLPQVFRNNNLTIQPDSRGTYIIGKFESYKVIPRKSLIDIREIPFPEYIETLNPINIYSESASILCAYNTGIIDDLLGQKVSFTVSGRMSTGKFSYFINNFNHNIPCEISVDNSQCEIDGGFEGDDVFAIIEAKNQDVDDFLIRQLYYPYRLWANKTSKRVIPIFLSYSNDIFSFYIYKFTDINKYNSIELVEQKKYQIGSNDIELNDITEMLSQVKIGPEPEGIPFPQADVFPRVLDLLMQIHSINSPLSQEDITINYAFNIRQAQYYADAAIYLGLIQKRYNRDQGVLYSMTEKGARIMKWTPKKRNLSLIKCILEKKYFNQALQLYIENFERPAREHIVEIMTNGNLNLSASTIERRSRTVLAWIDWIVRLT
jgi:hypothetical protein